MRLYFSLFFFIAIITFSSGQEKVNFSNVGITNFHFGYGWEFPIGDLKDRYGHNFKYTLASERMTRNNFVFGISFSYMFGKKVKVDVLAPLRLENEEVLGADNAYADVFLRQRGMFLGAHFGKVFRFNSKGKSGLRVTGAFGVLQHNVRIVDESNSLPQLNGDYIKGYDRLTRGYAFREFVGYHHVSEDKRINFIIGVEFTQGFTKHKRLIDFDTGLAPDSSTRFDGLISLKAAWIFPFFDDYQDEEIFY